MQSIEVESYAVDAEVRELKVDWRSRVQLMVEPDAMETPEALRGGRGRGGGEGGHNTHIASKEEQMRKRRRGHRRQCGNDSQWSGDNSGEGHG